MITSTQSRLSLLILCVLLCFMIAGCALAGSQATETWQPTGTTIPLPTLVPSEEATLEIVEVQKETATPVVEKVAPEMFSGSQIVGDEVEITKIADVNEYWSSIAGKLGKLLAERGTGYPTVGEAILENSIRFLRVGKDAGGNEVIESVFILPPSEGLGTSDWMMVVSAGENGFVPVQNDNELDLVRLVWGQGEGGREVLGIPTPEGGVMPVIQTTENEVAVMYVNYFGDSGDEVELVPLSAMGPEVKAKFMPGLEAAWERVWAEKGAEWEAQGYPANFRENSGKVERTIIKVGGKDVPVYGWRIGPLVYYQAAPLVDDDYDFEVGGGRKLAGEGLVPVASDSQLEGIPKAVLYLHAWRLGLADPLAYEPNIDDWIAQMMYILSLEEDDEQYQELAKYGFEVMKKDRNSYKVTELWDVEVGAPMVLVDLPQSSSRKPGYGLKASDNQTYYGWFNNEDGGSMIVRQIIGVEKDTIASWRGKGLSINDLYYIVSPASKKFPKEKGVSAIFDQNVFNVLLQFTRIGYEGKQQYGEPKVGWETVRVSD